MRRFQLFLICKHNVVAARATSVSAFIATKCTNSMKSGVVRSLWTGALIPIKCSFSLPRHSLSLSPKATYDWYRQGVHTRVGRVYWPAPGINTGSKHPTSLGMSSGNTSLISVSACRDLSSYQPYIIFILVSMPDLYLPHTSQQSVLDSIPRSDWNKKFEKCTQSQNQPGIGKKTTLDIRTRLVSLIQDEREYIYLSADQLLRFDQCWLGIFISRYQLRKLVLKLSQFGH